MIDITAFLAALLVGCMFCLARHWADKPMATRLTSKQQETRRRNRYE